MVSEIDPILSAILTLELPDMSSEVSDALDKLREEGAIAYQLGGDQHARATVEKYTGEIQVIERHADTILKNRAAPAATEVTDDDEHQHTLAKMETSLDRRRRNLSTWMRGELALGKSASELIDHAARHDQATANLMREVAEELEA
jgi:uncharacterized protein Yka (UPF0111/DUF47 family)